jgi:hypothetical protein
MVFHVSCCPTLLNLWRNPQVEAQFTICVLLPPFCWSFYWHAQAHPNSSYQMSSQIANSNTHQTTLWTLSFKGQLLIHHGLDFWNGTMQFVLPIELLVWNLMPLMWCCWHLSISKIESLKEILQCEILNHFKKQFDFAQCSWYLVHEKDCSNDFVTHQESHGLEKKFFCQQWL